MRSRSLVFIVGGLAAVVIAAALAYWFLVLQPRGAPPASVASAPTAPAPAPSSPAAAPTAAPSAAKPTAAAAPSPASTPAFDVVRVEPSGDAVVAGRATPGAQVELSDDGKKIGDAAADTAGQFVILPAPLSPGRHPLRLSAKVGDGAPQVSDVVVVEVAGAPAVAAASPAAKPAPAVAAASPAAKPAPSVEPRRRRPSLRPQPLSRRRRRPSPPRAPDAGRKRRRGARRRPRAPPRRRTPAASAAASTPTPAASAAASTPAPAAAPSPTPTATIVVAVASVRPIDPAGLEAVGSAPPGAHVRLRLNNAVLAEVVAGADGEWRLTIERGVTAGDYVLEAAVVDAAGTVLARAESPFVYPQREAVASAAPAASPSPTESPQAAPAAVREPTPAAATPAASTPVASSPVASTPAASTPVASAAPAMAPSPVAPSPASPAAVEPTPAASTPVAAAEPSSPAASSAAAEPTPTATPAAPAPDARARSERRSPAGALCARAGVDAGRIGNPGRNRRPCGRSPKCAPTR